MQCSRKGSSVEIIMQNNEVEIIIILHARQAAACDMLTHVSAPALVLSEDADATLLTSRGGN